MKNLLLLLLLAPVSGQGQQIKTSLSFGYALAEANGARQIMLSRGTALGIEFGSKTELHFCLEVDLVALSHNGMGMPGENLFFRHYFFNLPASLRKYFFLSRRSRTFFDLGLQAGSYFLQVKEIFTAQGRQKEELHFPGINWGLRGAAGMKTVISSSWYFETAIASCNSYPLFCLQPAGRLRSKQYLFELSFYKTLP